MQQPRLDLRLTQRLVLTPSLQQAIKLLQYSRQELVQYIRQELLENPTLEELQAEPIGPAPEVPPVATVAAEPDAAPSPDGDDESWTRYLESYDESYEQRGGAEEAPEYESALSHAESLADHLEQQLSVAVSTRRGSPDRDGDRRQHRRRRLPAGGGRGDRDPPRGRRRGGPAGAAHRSGVRPAGGRGARRRRVPGHPARAARARPGGSPSGWCVSTWPISRPGATSASPASRRSRSTRSSPPRGRSASSSPTPGASSPATRRRPSSRTSPSPRTGTSTR